MYCMLSPLTNIHKLTNIPIKRIDGYVSNKIICRKHTNIFVGNLCEWDCNQPCGILHEQKHGITSMGYMHKV